jgi:putative transposase
MEFMFHEDMRKTSEAVADANLRRFERMMGKISWFMRLLKQRFAIWYNRTYGREGTLWSERFKSVLVEAAYIDLNPIRAGIAKDPRKYRWCTIGAAMGGLRFAQGALEKVMAVAMREGEPRNTRNTRKSEGEGDAANSWGDVREWWCGQLAYEGQEVKDEEGKIVRRGMDAKVLEKMLKSGAQMSLAEVLCCRVRYFVDGGVIGSREFVKRVVAKERGKALPVNRKSEGKRMGSEASALGRLYSMRSVSDAFTSPKS